MIRGLSSGGSSGRGGKTANGGGSFVSLDTMDQELEDDLEHEIELDLEDSPLRTAGVNKLGLKTMLSDCNSDIDILLDSSDDEAFSDLTLGPNGAVMSSLSISRELKGTDLKLHGTEEASSVHLNSNGATAVHMFISFVGAGVLGLPFAFKTVGMLGALIVLPLIGVVTTYAMVIIVSCKLMLEKQGKRVRGYGDIGFMVSGRMGAAVVDTMIVITQVSFCCAYLLFIGENVQSVIPVVSSSLWILGCIPGLALLALFRHIKNLSPFALLADVANICGILVVVTFDAKQLHLHETVTTDHTLDALQLAAVISKLPYFVGVALYCFEGMGVIIHIQESMEHKESFNKVLIATMALVTAVNVVFGSMGYLAYGAGTREIVTLNLGGGLTTKIVKLALSVALYFTYPIMMLPVFRIVESSDRVASSSYAHKNVLRITAVILTVIVAIAIPNFGDFISLVGAGACAALALVLPAHFHNRLLSKTMSWSRWGLNSAIIVFGIVFGILGTLDAGSQLWHKFASTIFGAANPSEPNFATTPPVISTPSPVSSPVSLSIP